MKRINHECESQISHKKQKFQEISKAGRDHGIIKFTLEIDDTAQVLLGGSSAAIGKRSPVKCFKSSG